MKRYQRHSAVVISRKRWKRMRWRALQRDGFRCVQCGERGGRLEVDHILPVRTHPHLAYELSNLQTLDAPCHARKTRLEIGLGVVNPARDAWADLIRSPINEELKCLSQ